MLRQIWKVRAARYGLLLLLFVAIGYKSNTVTALACERSTSNWLDGILSQSNWPHRRASSEPAKFTYPWIVTVEYRWATGNLGAAHGVRYYFGIFGIPILLNNDVYSIA